MLKRTGLERMVGAVVGMGVFVNLHMRYVAASCNLKKGLGTVHILSFLLCEGVQLT